MYRSVVNLSHDGSGSGLSAAVVSLEENGNSGSFLAVVRSSCLALALCQKGIAVNLLE